MSDAAPESAPPDSPDPPPGDFLAPFETFRALRIRHGVMYHGRVRAAFAADREALGRALAAAPGPHHVEEIDGVLYATIRIYQEGREPKRRLWLHVAFFALAIITVLAAGAELNREHHRLIPLVPFDFVGRVVGSLGVDDAAAIMDEHWPRFVGEMLGGVPYAAALLFILLAHEMGHYVAARWYGVDATLPFVLPAPHFFGTFGAVIRMRSPIIHRRALFDIGIAGPIAGLVASVGVCCYGLRLSTYVITPTGNGPAFVFGESFAFEWLELLMNGRAPAGWQLMWHPVVLAGWFGLFITFLNLLPLGQLDGGHIWYALFGRGQRAVGLITFGMLLGLGLMFPGWWALALLVLAVLKIRHPRLVDESVRLDRGRLVLGAFIIVVFVLLFIPVPIDIYPG